jgi:excisionase family DNA binding protein
MAIVESEGRGTRDEGRELLTSRDAARLLNVGERTLWRWSRSGQCPAPVPLPGRTIRFSRRDLLEWLSAGCPRTNGRPKR